MFDHFLSRTMRIHEGQNSLVKEKCAQCKNYVWENQAICNRRPLSRLLPPPLCPCSSQLLSWRVGPPTLSLLLCSERNSIILKSCSHYAHTAVDALCPLKCTTFQLTRESALLHLVSEDPWSKILALMLILATCGKLEKALHCGIETKDTLET